MYVWPVLYERRGHRYRYKGGALMEISEDMKMDVWPVLYERKGTPIQIQRRRTDGDQRGNENGRST